MPSFGQRLRRVETIVDAGGVDAMLEPFMSDGPVTFAAEYRLPEFADLVGAQADARGVTVEALYQEIDDHFFDDHHPQPRWTKGGWVWGFVPW